jgi:hypothetical protein
MYLMLYLDLTGGKAIRECESRLLELLPSRAAESERILQRTMREPRLHPYGEGQSHNVFFSD